jgi:hypothetical protein
VPARVVGTVQDPPGDSGGPAHSDLVTVTFAEDSSTAVVTVEMGAGVPAKLTEGEVIGIGVDVYPSAEARESSHQLFADGNADGWRAYLQTPDGIVQYPGAFRLDGRRLVFTVPWSALGDPRRGLFTAFADFSRRSGAEQSRDDVPDSGRAAFTR